MDYLNALVNSELGKELENTLHAWCDGTKFIPNKYHNEPNVLEHVKLVYNEVLKNYNNDSDFEALKLGAVCHDLGKIITSNPFKGQTVTFHNHENVGFFYALNYFETHGINPKSKIALDALRITLYHDVHKFELEKLKEMYDYETLKLLLKFHRCDSLGRVPSRESELPYEIEPYELESKTYSKRIIFFIGLPHSGKTTFIKKYISCFKDFTILNRNDISNNIKSRLGTSDENEINLEAEKELDSRAQNCLKFGRNIIIDDINLCKKERTKILGKYKNLLKDYKKEAYIMTTTPKIIEERNLLSKNPVNPGDLNKIILSSCFPNYLEFDSINFI